MKKPSLVIVAASLLGAFALPASAQPAADSKAMVVTSPGQASIVQKRKLIATVESIDLAKREITLKGPKGKVMPLSVTPEVRNLEQVKVGDRLVVTYIEALSLTLKKDGKELRSSNTKTDGVRTAAGERPGGAVAEQVTVVADVIAVDRKTHMVTLKGPKQEVDLHVADPAQLKLIKVGDQVEAVYQQALAVGVEPAPAPK
jgi:Cu/Ag efflux protein CusF